jgi:hypothetical protein
MDFDGSGMLPRWREALGQMRKALAILDEAQAPPEIGSHLDLAIVRLESILNGPAPARRVEQSLDEIERLLWRD